MTTASGQTLWVQTDKVPILDEGGKVTGLLVFVVDITERKIAQDALALANKKLGLMASITRHDILNQIMALNAYLELSREAVPDPTVSEYLEKIAKISASMERHISFTRDYQTIGVQAPQWQDVGACIFRSTASLPMRNVRVATDLHEVKILADPLFEKIFYNLIDNALRYGGDGMKQIRISSEESDKGLAIIVEDDGAGVSREDKAHLFTKGFGKNTGLGLFLSKEILGITGMEIRENGTAGKGARFEISVPKGAYRLSR
jgi:signal transduction histidine kinase